MPLRSERRYMGVGDLKSGMMIQFNYTKKSGDSGDYIVLVVDPSIPNKYTGEPQLHGFTIKELSDSELIEFFSSFNTQVKIDYDNRRGSVVEGLNTDDAYSAFANSRYVEDRSYRTFNLSKISQLRQILVGSVD